MTSNYDAIVLRDVTLRYGSLKALDGISFTVPTGSVTGLIGRNGAGKTTSIRLLAGLLIPSPDGSTVRIQGRSPTGAERLEVLASTGFLLDHPALFPYLTPRETLRFLGGSYGLNADQSRSRTEDLLRLFEMEAIADRLTDTFSTGQTKRLSLAAALIHSPNVLILDEPFESLDPLMVRSLKRFLAAFATGGRSVLLSSHLIDAVEESCDRVVILERGRTVTEGMTRDTIRALEERLPLATLEDLYASLLPENSVPIPDWLLEPKTDG